MLSHILRNAKPPNERNISKEEEKALKDLKNDDSIVILPADKGKKTVVMNRKDYTEKIMTREPIARSPTKEKKQQLNGR